MRRFISSLAVSSLVGAFFTSALVIAQAPVPAPPPAAAVQEAFGKAKAVKRAVEQAKEVEAVVAPVVVQKAVVKRPAQQPNRAPMVQQFANQARPLLRAEIMFARTACQLNQEELRRVNQDAQKMLDDVVTKLVDAQFQPRPRVNFGPAAAAQAPNNPDAHQLLQDGVSAVMKKHLTAAQWSVYEKERGKRDENRKRMTIRYMVDAIDRELYLSPEQRDRIEDSLKTKWDSNWTLYLENHLYGNRFYPMTIDGLVTPVLSEAQKKVWQGVQKVGVYWGFAGMLGGFANDIDGLEVELGEPVNARPDQNQMRGMMKMQGAAVEFDANVVRPPVVKKWVSGVIQKNKAAALAKKAPEKTEKKAETTKD